MEIGQEGRQTSADKTTPKLVTEQLRASQKVLNKSDQFIPVVPVARGGAGGARAAFDRSTNETEALDEQPMRELDEMRLCGPSHRPASCPQPTVGLEIQTLVQGSNVLQSRKGRPGQHFVGH